MWNGHTCATQYFTLTTSVSAGSGSISVPGTSFPYGTSVTAIAVPNNGFTFSSWGGACASFSTSGCSVYMDSDKSISAAFTSQGTYTVSATAGAHGTVFPTSQTVIGDNKTTTVTVTPNAGYKASASGCNGALSGTTYTTGVITANCTVSATFDPALTFTGTASSPVSPLPSGVTAFLNWTPINVSTCTASSNNGATGWSGTVNALSSSQWPVNPPGGITSYSLECWNPGGVSTGKKDVVMYVLPLPTTVPSGSITSSSCSIAQGASSCAMNVAWSSSNTVGTVSVQRGYSPFGIIASGTNGNQSFTFSPANTYTLNLYDGNTYLGSGYFTASCTLGTAWEATNGTCVSTATTPSCPASTINGCSLSASISGSSGVCSPSYTGSCNYSCTSGTWNMNSNSCTASVAPDSSCSATTINGCSLPVSSSGSAGNCSSGYTGSCNYSCTSGTWSANSNSCAATSGTVVPTVSLSASLSTINNGQSSMLTWSSSNATDCTAVGGFSTGGATVNSSGVAVSPSSTTNYGITCTGTGGSVTGYAPITVLNPTSSISADDTRVTKSSPTTTIHWGISQVSDCTITRSIGSIGGKSIVWQSGLSADGSSEDTLTSRTIYTLACPGIPSKSFDVKYGAILKEF